MRDIEDDDETAAAVRHNELRDIHHRIDSLKEEGERQYGGLMERLHALEVAIARGNRFPAAAWLAALGLALTIVGTGSALYSKLETTHIIAQESKNAIEGHVTDMVPAQAMVWGMDERIKALEGRIVGQGPEGWHRRDHDLYARMMDERNDRVRARLDAIEKRQSELCERIRDCASAKR